MSKGALVGIESGSANPNLTTLVRLADALAVPVSALVEPAPTNEVKVVDPAAIDPLWRGAGGGEARLLFTTPPPAPVELWRWTLVPGEPYRSDAHPAGFVEAVAVLSGTLELVVGGERREVSAGSAATYRGDVAHAYGAAGAEPCVFLMTVHLPPQPR